VRSSGRLETVVSASPDIGYLHTGIERNRTEVLRRRHADRPHRLPWLPLSNNLLYCLAVEKLAATGDAAQSSVGSRDADRVELGFNSHLVGWVHAAPLIGAMSVFSIAFRRAGGDFAHFSKCFPASA